MSRGPQLRLTARTVKAIQDLVTHVDTASEDGVIDLDEQRRIRTLAHEAHRQSVDADDAIGLSITIARVGPHSRWAHLQGYEPDAA
jgi:hypothetical protein